MIAREASLFRIALQFLTIIPVGSMGAWPDDWLARSAKYMPLVGALIGAIAGTALLVSAAFFPEPLPAVIGLAIAVLLTGALHEDGLADTADGLGGGVTRERRIEILRDSRIGTYGVLALIAVFAFKGAALTALDPSSAARVLIAAHAIARLGAVLGIVALPYAGGENAKVSTPASKMTGGEIAIAILFGVLPGLIVLQFNVFLICTVFAMIAPVAIAFIAHRRIGGYTGDILGAIEQVFEAAFIVVAAGVLSGPG